MYPNPAFAVDDPGRLHDLVDDIGAAHLVAPTATGLAASLVPFLLDRDHGPHGRLRGHLARANPLWRAADGADTLAIFGGPGGYVSPGWYPTKATDPRVVPTWDYVVVHVAGRLVAHDDPAWTLAVVRDLTARHEAGRPRPGAVEDAPADHVERLLRAIVGIELVVERVEGIAKLSQNRPHDAAGVVDRLRALAGEGDPGAAALADAIHEAGG